ncbi:MAG: hypothetical protein HC812_09260 [Leptolyngbya sp. RL_3_1]|nr:hypothetical protein [Leptolyngbya sp. RL_3_1]
MPTTQEQILERLKLLPESMLKEVLLFVDVLLIRLKRPTQIVQPSTLAFAEALGQFRAQVEAEGSDIEEIDFFAA